MSKLFVTDMDGTLLNANKELPAAFAAMIKAMEEDGSFLAFASGRSYSGLKDHYGQYSDDFGYICDNGGMVVFHDEVLKIVTLTKTHLLEIQKLVQLHRKLVLVFCGTSHTFLMHTDPLDEAQIQELSFYYTDSKRIQSVEEIDEEIIKAALMYTDDIEKNILPMIRLDESLTYPVTGFCWIDIFQKDLSKGEGIAVLQERLNIAPEDTYVFGDYYNDLSMAEYAVHSYAMSNAVQEVKERFTDEIGSCEEGAAANQILKILSEA